MSSGLILSTKDESKNIPGAGEVFTFDHDELSASDSSNDDNEDDDQDEDEEEEDDDDSVVSDTSSEGFDTNKTPAAKVLELKTRIIKIDSMLHVLMTRIKDFVTPSTLSSSSLSTLEPSKTMTTTTQEQQTLVDPFFTSTFLPQLLATFERTLLNTHKSRFTQFLLFFACAHSRVLTDRFLVMLASRVFDGDAGAAATARGGGGGRILSGRVRVSAAAYLGSFVARAKFLGVAGGDDGGGENGDVDEKGEGDVCRSSSSSSSSSNSTGSGGESGSAANSCVLHCLRLLCGWAVRYVEVFEDDIPVSISSTASSSSTSMENLRILFPMARGHCTIFIFVAERWRRRCRWWCRWWCC